jgi:glycosyltransferase involved in cell wall biosynthesis
MVVKHPSRWLVLTQYYPPEVGAPQIRLRAMTQELMRHGIEVRVVTGMPNYPAGRIFPGYEGRRRVDETINGVPVTRLWVYAATGRAAHLRLANYLSFTFSALLAVLFGPRPDVMFVESQPLSLGVVAVLMKWLRGVPYIYNVPDLQVDVARQLGFMRSAVVLRLALWMENLFLQSAWRVSTVTDRFVEHFESRGLPRAQITFLPNGADTRFLRPMPPSCSLTARWGLDGKKVFVYVGTHAYYHGLDTLIDAAALLRNRTDISFLLIGDGPERKRLQDRARVEALDNVVFGESPYEEMDQLYSIAWASIATLRKMDVARGMRLSKIFPSLSCAVPVIYSGEGEAADLLAAHRCGLVVEPENPAQLAEAVVRLASDDVLRADLGRAGRAFVESAYSWTAIVRAWLLEIGYVSDTEGPAGEEVTLEAGHPRAAGVQGAGSSLTP